MDKSAEKPKPLYSNDINEDPIKSSYCDSTNHRQFTNDELLDSQSNHTDLTEKRKKYWFYRGNGNSQLDNPQSRPSWFSKYGDDSESSVNSYQFPIVEKFTSSIQYCRKAKIFDKFVQVVNPKSDSSLAFIDKTPDKLPFPYRQHCNLQGWVRMINKSRSINSSHEQRRLVQVNLLADPKKLKNRELTGVRNSKRKDNLHIHKSFSFKCTSKRENNKLLQKDSVR